MEVFAMVAINATDVRREFSEFLDEAVKKPQYTRRRKQIYITIPCETLDRIFPYKIRVIIKKDSDGGYYSQNDMLPSIIGYGATKKAALESLREDLIAYAYEYNDNFPLYSVAPNRADDLPIVMKILSHYEKDGDISAVIEVR
jgi:predicted RNase H-like HicB family nuclease